MLSGELRIVNTILTCCELLHHREKLEEDVEFRVVGDISELQSQVEKTTGTTTNGASDGPQPGTSQGTYKSSEHKKPLHYHCSLSFFATMYHNDYRW